MNVIDSSWHTITMKSWYRKPKTNVSPEAYARIAPPGLGLSAQKWAEPGRLKASHGVVGTNQHPLLQSLEERCWRAGTDAVGREDKDILVQSHEADFREGGRPLRRRGGHTHACGPSGLRSVRERVRRAAPLAYAHRASPGVCGP